MSEIHSTAFSATELRAMILGIQVLREVKNGAFATSEASTIAPERLIIQKFNEERRVEHQRGDDHLAGIIGKLEAFLITAELPEMDKDIGQEWPQERAVSDGI
ncbi:hypothetical protein SAMN04487996_1048 [Dyadobacter soli]|uniref:Uncharacterized protein n=1 Tax=Dyadobacter soli TaxID=659014 RepID=A0A1G7AY14_9BACT|nr:hypothetical protein [Dyadobacter soli]SDE19661.1 hypothetical protein SAMN04487996_1048 [Dyadobacter soli]